jgi:hypothetical protein
MSKDNPDTFPMEESTGWESTQMDDVFQPSVRVLLSWRDLEAAAERGAVVSGQVHGLWAAWAAPGSPLRRQAGALENGFVSTRNEPTWSEELPDTDGPPSLGLALRALVAGVVIGAVAVYLLVG